jgi:Na+-transporting NADH:ubiquinone oxidoreductase subunit F
VLEAAGQEAPPVYRPGDYLQFDIPAYGDIAFKELTVNRPYLDDWRERQLFELRSENAMPMRRNYSFASNPAVDRELRFNVRIAMPPHGQSCPAGAGSAYVHRLKPGDSITAIGPFGSFHIKSGSAEMVYVGGGAGMAPLRSHLSHLFDTLKTERRVSFWYGARSRKEIFYQGYFDSLAQRFRNFSFHIALSEPRPEDIWTGPVGLIHEVLRDGYLKDHANPPGVEYYLCGPPAMIKATTAMLRELRVAEPQISFDEF